MSVPLLLFVRHGETDWNREFRLQGQRDIPLNVRGREQAARNGLVLAPLLADRNWHRVASPLSRARETMEIALAGAGLADEPYELDDRLIEVSFGRWEGFTIEELAEAGDHSARGRDDDKWNFVPPGGESYAILAERVDAWLNSLSGPTLAVAHGGVMRVLLHLIAGVPADEAPMLQTPQDRVLRFENGVVEYH